MRLLKTVTTVLTVLTILTVICPLVSVAQIRAFPSAQGYGAVAVGGRGGAVHKVTNLNDSGAGSLRACTDASGARICIFEVGGTITLSSQIRINNPNITIAGQTAPGDGILLTKTTGVDANTMQIATQEVIIRHFRIRHSSGGGRDALGTLTSAAPASLMLDHLSVSWGTDGTADLSGDNITLQWSIVSEGLENSTHSSGPHSTGSLLNGNNISIHHSLYAHNMERNPRVQSNSGLEVVNNVIYNPGFTGSFGPSHITSDPLANYIANTLIAGANSGTLDWFVSTDTSTPVIYVSGNDVPVDDVRPSDAGFVSGTQQPISAYPITVQTSADSYTSVLAAAGALPHDAVDTRVIGDVIALTGAVIDDPSDVGGLPTLAGGTAPTDTDGDGMPDSWESACGLDSGDGADGALTAANGYTNLENYLNQLAGDTIPLAPCGVAASGNECQ